MAFDVLSQQGSNDVPSQQGSSDSIINRQTGLCTCSRSNTENYCITYSANGTPFDVLHDRKSNDTLSQQKLNDATTNCQVDPRSCGRENVENHCSTDCGADVRAFDVLSQQGSNDVLSQQNSSDAITNCQTGLCTCNRSNTDNYSITCSTKSTTFDGLCDRKSNDMQSQQNSNDLTINCQADPGLCGRASIEKHFSTCDVKEITFDVLSQQGSNDALSQHNSNDTIMNPQKGLCTCSRSNTENYCITCSTKSATFDELRNQGSNDILSQQNSHDATVNCQTDPASCCRLNAEDHCNQIAGVNQGNISCLLLNVCGLRSKLKGVEFENVMSKYDIVMLTETKLSDNSPNDIEIPGYKFFPKNRKKAKAASGGVAVFIRDRLLADCEFVEGNCEFVLWFKINSPTESGTLIGIVYIPPENTKYSNIKMFDELESDIVLFTSGKDLRVILFGDFNARTSNLTDCLFLDNAICKAVDFSDDIRQELFDEYDTVINSIDQQRHSQDTVCDNYGTRFLNVCKALGLYILNGRVGSDKNIGQTTCRGASVVDYVIASAEVFQHVNSFLIMPFDPMLSDVHNSVVISFNALNKRAEHIVNIENNLNVEKLDLAPKRPKWKSNLKNIFLENICVGQIAEVENKLAVLEASQDSITSEQIDNIVNMVRNIFDSSAATCGFISESTHTRHKGPKPYNRKEPQKPWFNKKCESARKAYHVEKNVYNLNRNQGNQDKLRGASKKYKAQINIEYNLYHKDLVEKIRKLKSNDPKEYWSLIKDLENGSNCRDKCEVPMETLKEHFVKLNKGPPNNVENEFITAVNNDNDDNFLNSPFTEKEILEAIKRLKNNKACGLDKVVNEYIKSTSDLMIQLYVKLFNIVLNTGIIPSDWPLGIIKPLYKNKGSKQDPNNYRGITILSCLGKLFTSVINHRLEQFLKAAEYIGPEQAGFRKDFSTADHIFTLHGLIDMYLNHGKRLYCCFVDYQKAFDSVDRTELWRKVINSNIKGKIFNIIYNMYKQAKSSVSVGGRLSDFFSCDVGVRQGENLSPLLFAVFLNDLEGFLSQYYEGLYFARNIVSDELAVLIKLYILLYADDTVILSEDPTQLQKALNGMWDYCVKNKLTVNSAKTKVVVFSKGKVRSYPDFIFGNGKLEVVGQYTYLGIIFNFNGKFKNAIERLENQATKAMYALLHKARKLCLPVDIQIQLFEAMIKPIILYGSEVWGYQSLKRSRESFLKISFT
jgi:exonuclease III